MANWGDEPRAFYEGEDFKLYTAEEYDKLKRRRIAKLRHQIYEGLLWTIFVLLCILLFVIAWHPWSP